MFSATAAGLAILLGVSVVFEFAKVIFDEDALAIGSSIYAYSAMRWLEDHS